MLKTRRMMTRKNLKLLLIPALAISLTSLSASADGGCLDQYRRHTREAERQTRVKTKRIKAVVSIAAAIPTGLLLGSSIAAVDGEAEGAVVGVMGGALFGAAPVNAILHETVFESSLEQALDAVNWAYQDVAELPLPELPKKLEGLRNRILLLTLRNENPELSKRELKRLYRQEKQNPQPEIENRIREAIQRGVETYEFCKREEPAGIKSVMQYVQQELRDALQPR